MKYKFIIVFFITATIVVIGYLFYNHLSFAGLFDKKYAREDVIENFIQNENDFLDLEKYFYSKIPNSKKQIVTFGLGEESNQVTLSVYPLEGSISKSNPVIGGSSLKLNSTKLDSAIVALGWTNETIDTLKNKLNKTNSKLIRTDPYHDAIEIFYERSNFGLFSYRIFNQPISDSLILIHGKPLSNSGFSSRVVISYNSAL